METHIVFGAQCGGTLVRLRAAEPAGVPVLRSVLLGPVPE